MAALRKQARHRLDPEPAGCLAERLSLPVCDGVTVRLLALELGAPGNDFYRVVFRAAPAATFRTGLMKHTGGQSWELIEGHSVTCANLAFGSPDTVFSIGLGESEGVTRALTGKVRQAAPHWPRAVTQRLCRRRLRGAGTVAFDADWFLSELATSAFDRPLLFPGAASKLGLAGLERASSLLKCIADARVNDKLEEAPEPSWLARVLLSALSAQPTTDSASHWDGEGRIVGEYTSGGHGQLGSDIGDGCRAVLGSGPLHVAFDPAELLGLGLGPLQAPQAGTDIGEAGSVGSAGQGAEVGEVDADGAAERAGVLPGMALRRFSNPDLELSSGERSALSFEAILNELDQRRAAGGAFTVTFDTAAAVTRLYAVEMPAAAAFAALAAAFDGHARGDARIDLGLDAALPGPALLWREDTPRLFLGEAGSVTCAHTDICPQLELAHALLGVKILGIASRQATPRLSAEHGGGNGEDDDQDHDHADDEEPTRVHTDRPLTARQSRLLGDAEVTLALLQAGDLAVFDSGALHFASNGAGGLSGAIYHGVITAAAVPRLQLAAAKASGSDRDSDDAYGNHLFAADLLRIVEPLLATPRVERPPRSPSG